MSNNNNTILGILVGTAIGATLGVLFAPDKGINTRRKIADEANAAKEKFTDAASDLKERIVNTTINSKKSLDEEVEMLISKASFKAEDIIESLEKKLKDLKEQNKKLQKT